MIVYRCSRCGYVLFKAWICNEKVLGKRGHRRRYVVICTEPSSRYIGIPTPEDIAALYGFRCPRCGNRLDTGKKITIKLADTTSRDR